jgi:serine/threonine protein kinase
VASTGWRTHGSKASAASQPVRLARALASPVGVLITVPLLVIAVGLGILLVGRDATQSASWSMAKRQLREQAKSVQADVTFALDQAGPLLERVRVLADPARPTEDTLVRLHDLVVARPGVSYVSISFAADGTFLQANFTKDKVIEVQESRVTARGTQVRWFLVKGGVLEPLREKVTDYDPRKRPFYALATTTKARAWTPPYTFFLSHETGITCTEPVYDGDTLRAVLTVDFDINALSSYVARPALDGARSIVYAGDGVVLAYPNASVDVGDRLLKFTDLKDPALVALFAQQPSPEMRVLELAASDGDYLASVAPIGGARAGVTVPLDWYVGTIVPTSTLLGPTRKLERSSAIASAGALAIAVGIALILAWNLVRMRRQVAQSKEAARSAEARAREMGSYKLVARLGSGGMGEVWRAEHQLLARSAAIKLIRPEALDNPESVDEIRGRFRREAQTLASMKSRHTIEIFDFGVTEAGVFYYVMELLDGLDLESLILRYGAQPPARVIQIMIQACSSLGEAHEAGLLHRDIKPPNLYLSRAADEIDIVKLLDFGIVHAAGDALERQTQAISLDESLQTKLTQVGAMLGTPGFMAPEQILGDRIDGRADLYALGCCAWWLLAGREVFARVEGSEAKILHKHLHDPVPPLSEAIRGWYPAELEGILHACLAKEPGDRPATARALAAWTEAKARAWWAEYQPARPAPAIATAEQQVIMPGKAAPFRGDVAISPTIRPDQ